MSSASRMLPGAETMLDGSGVPDDPRIPVGAVD